MITLWPLMSWSGFRCKAAALHTPYTQNHVYYQISHFYCCEDNSSWKTYFAIDYSQYIIGILSTITIIHDLCRSETGSNTLRTRNNYFPEQVIGSAVSK